MGQQPGIGVIIARFQTTELHAGHRALLDEVTSRHRHVLVVLGVARTYVPTFANPLDIERRAEMVRQRYQNVKVVSNRDCRSNRVWSENLDSLILDAFPGETEATLYGSRGSFIPSYSGRFRCVELPEAAIVSATELRQEAVDHPALTREFRAGMIYMATKRPPLVFQTVDVAVLDGDRERVLLGSKREDEGLLRFIGGFVDGADPSLEVAARREAFEETGGIELADFRYVGSLKVDDWRYRKTRDSIMTALFTATHVFGSPKASDDLDGSCEWYGFVPGFATSTTGTPAESLEPRLVEEHRPLLRMLIKYGQEQKWWRA